MFDDYEGYLGRPMHFDRQGNPLTLWEWIPLHGDPKYRRVAATQLGFDGGIFVSTVWLGTDHSFGTGPPLIFETMVFDRTTSASMANDLFMDRYSTEEQALAGHEAMVALVRHELELAVIDEVEIHEETGC